ncbi:hypothetical protein F441_04334 [Phytophthora nicotianae CJ01A1]|uniref:Enoyl reductase (ER) domain-containing protein n=9 Tax=Phytophthora nicotianae TaxID=4792 RepID=V9DZL5_PHYNI|nr:hypothetical protein PPTG_06297 [Phytophthora nicotianae INRA-310]ETI31452.1 hypothetical protein F443_21578 [Phytophthora nicotianae P1569]ETO60180.1 hypothetical protein F444_21588 [Phytophthora nicotianae P1976]ETP22324.1 hypothetical protein F441_04334 [Phytophthora nicotianae CJ01A1]ETP29432.1 hypothetical protein F442_21413 [Phytophthora nicotianae P10297]KUF82080.1 NADP-dependent alcohol dehydrogenase C 2 [Phytophthora nicotianae]
MSTEPRTIKAYACFGKKEEVKPWEYKSRPLGPGDVEVKISHCGICGSDLHTMDSGWGPSIYPCVVGHEIIGEITLAGDEVKGMKVGDRVGVGAQVFACLNKDPASPCKLCSAGDDAYCPHRVWTYSDRYADKTVTYGGYAEYIRVMHEYAFKIPDNIPSDVAAPLLCAGATVFRPLKEAGVKPGKRVGIVGIGGLGHLAIQFAKAMGADAVVAFSRSPNKEKEVRDLGATDFVNYTDEKQATAAEKTIDVLLVCANADNMPYTLFLSFLAVRGSLIMVGLPNDDVKFSAFGVVAKGANFGGSNIGSIKDIKDMLEVASKKNVRPVIQKLPMSKANEGIKMVRDGSVRYRVVLEN